MKSLARQAVMRGKRLAMFGVRVGADGGRCVLHRREGGTLLRQKLRWVFPANFLDMKLLDCHLFAGQWGRFVNVVLRRPETRFMAYNALNGH